MFTCHFVYRLFPGLLCQPALVRSIGSCQQILNDLVLWTVLRKKFRLFSGQKQLHKVNCRDPVFIRVAKQLTHCLR